MLKRLILALGLIGLVSPALAAGTIPFSLSQQLDEHGTPLSGCKLYIIQAGTTSTPQNPFSDSALSMAIANPIVCDSAGRLPQFFLADGTIKVRLTKSTGVVVVTADNIAVIGASSGGGGGGGTVDATTVFVVGDIKVKYGTGNISGWVRANGRTIGSVASGATERANADTEVLFEYLWGDNSLSVSGGRGASAAADFAADKTIVLPDWRGRAIAGLDDMGNSAAGRLTATYFGTSAIVLGAAGGVQSVSLGTANMAPYTPSGTVGITDPGHVHSYTVTAVGAGTGTSPNYFFSSAAAANTGAAFTGITASFAGNAQGGTSAAFPIVMPTMLATVYLKL